MKILKAILAFLAFSLRFSGILLAEALLVFAINGDLLLILFPATWAFYGGVVNFISIFLFISITALSYIVGGLLLTSVYTLLSVVIPRKVAFIITALLPIVVGAVLYFQYNV